MVSTAWHRADKCEGLKTSRVRAERGCGRGSSFRCCAACDAPARADRFAQIQRPRVCLVSSRRALTARVVAFQRANRLRHALVFALGFDSAISRAAEIAELEAGCRRWERTAECRVAGREAKRANLPRVSSDPNFPRADNRGSNEQIAPRLLRRPICREPRGLPCEEARADSGAPTQMIRGPASKL
jgi:hypothetical protein